ncbi:hypothetical protein QAD02_003351 [Eretmocerus hayati]|uniref:Uncharacterized protein n=1 Tax=Eretmocerus hayati TaxID=131215 RepID=A0ACC2NLV7_9HYME|nr:hypothetical protein QAD02_003351 [Eretmocerus hayati]
MTRPAARPIDPNDERPMHINRNRIPETLDASNDQEQAPMTQTADPQLLATGNENGGGAPIKLGTGTSLTVDQQNATGTKPKEPGPKERGERRKRDNTFPFRVTRASTRNLINLECDDEIGGMHSGSSIDPKLRNDVRRSLERGAQNPGIGPTGSPHQSELDETRSEAGLEPSV